MFWRGVSSRQAAERIAKNVMFKAVKLRDDILFNLETVLRGFKSVERSARGNTLGCANDSGLMGQPSLLIHSSKYRQQLKQT